MLMSDLCSTIKLVSKCDSLHSFLIEEGIFAGVEYNVDIRSINKVDEDKITVDYDITNTDMLNDIVLELMEKIIRADLEKRLLMARKNKQSEGLE